MASDLYPYGFQRVPWAEPADLYIINTCTVTHRGDSSSRNAIRRAARANPGAKIVVAGCYVDSDPAKIAGLDGVDVLIPNARKQDIARILPERLPDLFSAEPDKNCSATIPDFFEYNRAWLKISDGCNQWCSFCILPTVRGRLRNRPPLEIIDEIGGLVANGFNEVVLTGIHLGHYKNRKSEPQVKNLAALCRMIMDRTEVGRIRISSIEPQTVRDDLVQTYANSSGRICRHFHLPLQSGSSRILKAMRRPYDQNTYIRRATAVKDAVPETIIGADVIVGFPGETDDDFAKTRRVCDSGLIDYLHVFSYSDRPGTHASALPDKVHPEVIKERNALLTQISHDIRARAYRRQIGKTLDVIAENRQQGKGFYWGISDNYIKVRLPESHPGGRGIVRVKIESASGCDYVTGSVVSSQVA
jgi:threonylcarbamoyladenosine tRNA methylthiotransferase MtaB